MELNDFRVKSSKLNVEAIDVEYVISLVDSFFNIGLIHNLKNENQKINQKINLNQNKTDKVINLNLDN